MLKTILLTILFMSCVSAQVLRAVVNIANGNATGTITITETNSGLSYSGTIRFLTPGQHGFHIHTFGDLSGGCASTGPHYNPLNQNHGGLTSSVRHVGDLGNIIAANTGIATVFFTHQLTSLRGPNSILNRALVVHQDVDDLGLGGFPDSLTTGHSGARIACGIITQV